MKNEIIINTFADVIKKCLYKVSKVQSDNECRKIIFDELNNFFRSKTSISFSLDDNIKNYALAILDKKNQDILKIFNCNDSYDNNNKYSVVNVEEHLENLKKTIEAIDDKNGYGDEVLTRYLKAYTECSKKVVLNNNKLYNEIFRNSKLIKNLHNIGTVPNEKLEERDLMYVSLYSPYTVFAIIEIINDLVKYRKEINDNSLSNVRCNLFIKEELKKFKRLSSGMSNLWDSRRVYYDEKSDEIISFPTNYLSSIEPINSVYLVDKIKNYIRNEIKDNYINLNDKSIDVNILTIGSINKYNELDSLLDIIINWFNRNYDKLKLNLNITSIISDKDIFEHKININKELNGNKVSVKTKELDYYQILFDIDMLKNYILNNDIIFVLNCPFMFMESFSVNADNSISYQARFIKENANMDELNNFYKIIIDSDENKYSRKIGRLIYDYNLEYMIDLVKTSNSEKLKELYVSVDDSYAGYSTPFDYSLSKEEMNNTNIITFSKYSNKPERQLDYDVTNEINFKVSIWTLFKHISSDYLFNNLGRVLNNILGKFLNDEKIFALFNNVCLDFTINMYDIDISIKYLELFDKILVNELGVEENMLNIVKNNINNNFSKILKPLFENVIFSNFNNKEDEIMKKAFYYAVYESAKKVNDMHFLHNYMHGLKNNRIRYFASFNDEYIKNNIPNDYVCNESFNDKYLYKMAMNQCEVNYQLTIGQIALMKEYNHIFKQGALAYHTLSNIEKLCERYGDYTGNLKKNATSAKKLLK